MISTKDNSVYISKAVEQETNDSDWAFIKEATVEYTVDNIPEVEGQYDKDNLIVGKDSDIENGTDLSIVFLDKTILPMTALTISEDSIGKHIPITDDVKNKRLNIYVKTEQQLIDKTILKSASKLSTMAVSRNGKFMAIYTSDSEVSIFYRAEIEDQWALREVVTKPTGATNYDLYMSDDGLRLYFSNDINENGTPKLKVMIRPTIYDTFRIDESKSLNIYAMYFSISSDETTFVCINKDEVIILPMSVDGIGDSPGGYRISGYIKDNDIDPTILSYNGGLDYYHGTEYNYRGIEINSAGDRILVLEGNTNASGLPSGIDKGGGLVTFDRLEAGGWTNTGKYTSGNYNPLDATISDDGLFAHILFQVDSSTSNLISLKRDNVGSDFTFSSTTNYNSSKKYVSLRDTSLSLINNKIISMNIHRITSIDSSSDNSKMIYKEYSSKIKITKKPNIELGISLEDSATRCISSIDKKGFPLQKISSNKTTFVGTAVKQGMLRTGDNINIDGVVVKTTKVEIIANDTNSGFIYTINFKPQSSDPLIVHIPDRLYNLSLSETTYTNGLFKNKYTYNSDKIGRAISFKLTCGKGVTIKDGLRILLNKKI